VAAQVEEVAALLTQALHKHKHSHALRGKQEALHKHAFPRVLREQRHLFGVHGPRPRIPALPTIDHKLLARIMISKRVASERPANQEIQIIMRIQHSVRQVENNGM
jgi:hypothetical protein